MSHLKERSRALLSLKWLFIASAIIMGLALVFAVVINGLAQTTIFEENPGAANAIANMEIVIYVLKLLVFIGSIITTVMALKISKETKIAFFISLGVVAVYIAAFIVSVTAHLVFTQEILMLVGSVGYIVALYSLFKGLLPSEGKGMGPFQQIMCVCLVFVLVYQVLSFVGFAGGVPSGVDLALHGIGLSVALVAFLVLAFCSNQMLKGLKEQKELTEEVK